MHISTPPQVLPADALLQDSPAENLAYASPFLEGESDKHQGIFARLLEAFTESAEEALTLQEDEAAAEKAIWQISAHLNQAAMTNELLSPDNPPPEFQAEAAAFDGRGISSVMPGLFSQELRQELRAAQDQIIKAALEDSSAHMNADKEGAPVLLAAEKTEELPDIDLLSGRPENKDAEMAQAAAGNRETPAEKTEAESPFAKHTNPESSRYEASLIPAGREGENPLISELRERRERERPVIEVRDFRTPQAREAAGLGTEGYKGAQFNPTHSEIGINVDLKPSPQMGDGWNTRGNGREFSQSRLFEDALARELRGNLSADIVKNATLIVRNGGEGTIRLALNPASLGHVKVHLEMTENKIMGHIIVESSEALRAFQRELPALERAFRDSGFIETSLDMSLAQDGGEFSEEQQQWPEGNFPALDPALASRYDAGREVTELAEDASASGAQLLTASERRSVNLFI